LEAKNSDAHHNEFIIFRFDRSISHANSSRRFNMDGAKIVDFTSGFSKVSHFLHRNCLFFIVSFFAEADTAIVIPHQPFVLTVNVLFRVMFFKRMLATFIDKLRLVFYIKLAFNSYWFAKLCAIF
jgi:hypothetical protein